jgi:hypothetical protein
MLRAFVPGTGHDAMVFTKSLNVLIFQRRNKDHCALVNCLPNWKLKNQGGALIL